MLCRLTATASATFEADECEASWCAPFSGEWGSASVFVPRNSPAWQVGVLSASGGFLVQLSDPAGGTWSGIADVPTFSARGAVVTARHVTALLGNHRVKTPRRFVAAPAGLIARHAIREALAGAPSGLMAGDCCESAPIVPYYEFRGQSVAEVFRDLIDATGQEWRLTGNGQLDWCAPYGRLIDTAVLEGGLIDTVSRTTATDWGAEQVIVRNAEGHEQTEQAWSGEGLYPVQRLETSSARSAVRLALEARALLATRRHAPVTLATRILRSHFTAPAPIVNPGSSGWGFDWGYDWGGTSGSGTVETGTAALGVLREGDWLRLHAPSVGLAGLSVVARVASRTIREGSAYMDLSLVVQPHNERLPALFDGLQGTALPATRQPEARLPAAIRETQRAMAVAEREAVLTGNEREALRGRPTRGSVYRQVALNAYRDRVRELRGW